jgi:hypothetical protein
MEKWSEWFYSNVEETFRSLHEREEDQNIYGEGGFATGEEIDHAARGIMQGTPASEQRFRD